MRQRALVALVLVAMLLAGGAAIAYAQESTPWLHIRVTEDGEDGARINVNLPVTLVQTFADLAEQEIERELSGRGSHVRVHMERHEVEIADIRRAWNELRNAGDAEFVEIEDGDEYIKISRAGDRVVIELDDRDGNDGRGRVEVPVSVVDALLEGEGETLNVRAAIDELIAVSSGEIAFVEDGGTTVRIWIE